MKLMGQDQNAVMHETRCNASAGTVTDKDKGSVGMQQSGHGSTKRKNRCAESLPSGVCLIHTEGQMATDPFLL